MSNTNIVLVEQVILGVATDGRMFVITKVEGKPDAFSPVSPDEEGHRHLATMYGATFLRGQKLAGKEKMQ